MKENKSKNKFFFLFLLLLLVSISGCSSRYVLLNIGSTISNSSIINITNNILLNGSYWNDSSVKNTSTSIYSNNGMFIYNYTSSYLGVGNNYPVARIYSFTNLSTDINYMAEKTTNDSGAPQFTYRKARVNSSGGLTGLLTGDIFFNINGQGYGATTYGSAGTGSFRAYAQQNFNDTAKGTYLQFSTAPMNSINQVERLRINESGLTIANGVYVTSDVNINGTFYFNVSTNTGSFGLGIGTINPVFPLHISRASAGMLVENTNSPSATGGGVNQVAIYHLPNASGQRLGAYAFQSRNNDTGSLNGASITAFSEDVWINGSSYPSYMVFSTTQNSSSTPTERLRLNISGIFVNGTIIVNNKYGIDKNIVVSNGTLSTCSLNFSGGILFATTC